LRFVPRDVDAPPPVVVGDAGGDLLPYAVDSSVVVLHANGSRAFSWTAPAPPLELSAGSGDVAVTLPGGRVVVLDSTGRIVSDRTFDATVLGARVTSSGLVLRRARSLGLADEKPWPLPAHARPPRRAADPSSRDRPSRTTGTRLTRAATPPRGGALSSRGRPASRRAHSARMQGSDRRSRPQAAEQVARAGRGACGSDGRKC